MMAMWACAEADQGTRNAAGSSGSSGSGTGTTGSGGTTPAGGTTGATTGSGGTTTGGSGAGGRGGSAGSAGGSGGSGGSTGGSGGSGGSAGGSGGSGGSAGGSGGSGGSAGGSGGSGGSAGAAVGGSSGTGTGGSSGASGGAGGSAGGGTGIMACGSTTVPVANPVISTFDGTMDMGLSVTAVSPGGRWSVDKAVATDTITLEVADSGDTIQLKAAHFHGTATGWGADMAATFSGIVTAMKPTGVDASGYTGLSFKIKASAALAVIVKLQNEDSLPACALCDPAAAPSSGRECSAGYQTTVMVAGTAWQTVQLPWSSFLPAPWGYHAPGATAINSKQVFVLAIAVNPMAFDIWVDDFQFYR